MRRVNDFQFGIQRWFRLVGLLFLGICISFGTASAAVIAEYNVASHLVTSSQTSMPASYASSHAGLTHSAISFGTGNDVVGSWPNGGSFCAQDWSTTSQADEYLEMSLTPLSGNQISFTTVQFALARDNYGTSDVGVTSVDLKYSRNGSPFTLLQSMQMPLATVGDLEQKQFTVNLSSLINIDTAITFRWYGYGTSQVWTDLCFANASGGNFSGTGKNLIFNGSVSAPNEYPTAINLSISGDGDPTVGQTLTANYTYQDNESDPQSGATFQWYRADDGVGTNKAAIAGATGQTYTPTSDDGHKYLTFTVTPMASSGSTPGSAYESPASARINRTWPYATGVSISGVEMIGEVLTGNYTYNNDLGYLESGSTYQWYRADNMSGANRTPISGANGLTHTLTGAVEGYNISFEVTVRASNGVWTNPLESEYTLGVIPPVIAHYSVHDHTVTNNKTELSQEYVIAYPGVTASALTLGPGLIGKVNTSTFDGGSFCAERFTASSTFDSDDYFQVVLTPEAESRISYEQLSFALARENDAGTYLGPAKVDLKYSTNGVDFTHLKTFVPSTTVLMQTKFLNEDISVIGSVAGPVWFRWYGYQASGLNSQNAELCFANAPAASTVFSGTGVDLVIEGTVGAMNSAPTISGAPPSVTATEDTESNIILSAVEFADTDGDNLTVTLAASAGVFSAPADGSGVGAGVTATLVNPATTTLAGSAADINTYLDTAANIKYTGANDVSGLAAATLTISATDGTASLVSDPVVNINITAVNDVPSFVKGAGQTASEDSGVQSVTGWATSISKGPADESAQTVTFEVTNNTNSALFSAGPDIASNGDLTFTPATDANGSATITLRVSDNGGTANSGIDTSPTQSFVITVNPVNDVPSFTKGADQTVNEDAGAQTASGWATVISKGPANESSETVTFEVTNNTNPALFSAGPAIASNGNLTYTPAVNANGSATVTLRIKDDGGSANGGVDTSATQSFNITVNPINDAPTNITLGISNVDENQPANSVIGILTTTDPDG